VKAESAAVRISSIAAANSAALVMVMVAGAVAVVFMPKDSHDCGFVSMKYFKQSFNRLDINTLQREIIPTTTD